MAVIACMFGGFAGMLSALIGGLFFDVGFWGAMALFLAVGNGLALFLILSTLLGMASQQRLDQCAGDDAAGPARTY